MRQKLRQISIFLGVIVGLISLTLYISPDLIRTVHTNDNVIEQEEKEHSNLLSTSSKIVKTLLSIRP
ncbi:MAG: hypothetical protein AAF363_17875 [Bacteroidota bacterium]